MKNKKQMHQGGDASANKEENNKNEKQHFKLINFRIILLSQNYSILNFSV